MGKSRVKTSFTGSRTIRLVSDRRRDSTAQPWPHQQLHPPTRLWWPTTIIIITIILFFSTIIMVLPCIGLLRSILSLTKKIISFIRTYLIPTFITVNNFFIYVLFFFFWLWCLFSLHYVLWIIYTTSYYMNKQIKCRNLRRFTCYIYV